MSIMSKDPQRNEGPKKNALGKGFNSLFGLTPEEQQALEQVATPNEGKAGTPIRVNITDIEPNPHQPRKIFEDEKLKELSQSISVDGVIQPLLVTKSTKPGRYILIAGERRWRASKLAGLETVPVIIKEGTPDEMLRLALIENIQRADLSVIEEAEAYQSLINDFGLTQEQCAQKVGKDRTTVTNALRLLSLPKEIQDDLLEGRLTMGHGRSLLSLEDKKLMLRARDIVVKKLLSVRQTEQLCRTFGSQTPELQGGDEDAEGSSETNADLEHLAEMIRGHLRTKVRLSGNGSRGKIEISYFSAAELERILESLGMQQI